MGRVYTARAVASVAGIQDLMSLLPGAKAIAVHEVAIGQTSTTTTISILQLSMKRMTGALTAGSGGAAVSPQKVDTGGIAATTTARANDTTQAVAATPIIMRQEGYNTVNTYQYLPPPEDRIIVGPGEQFVVSLDTAPAAAQTTIITVVFEELF